MAFASLGNLLLPISPILKYSCGGISLILILFFCTRVYFDFNGILKDIQHPVGFSVLPAFCMTWMLLASYFRPFIGEFALLIWCFALVLNLILVIAFTKKFVLSPKIDNVYPSWFVMYVGFVVGSVTSPSMGMEMVGQVLFYFGFIFYLCLLPFALHRTVRMKNIERAYLPTIAIFAASANLCIVGHLSAFGDKPNHNLLLILTVLAIISYLLVLFSLTKLIRLEFYPSFAAFTFPLVISAIAIQKLIAYYNMPNNLLMHGIDLIATLIACVIVIYVTIHYILYIIKLINSGKSELI